MIVLGKDKVDERYNIDDNGTITDLQGNIQETNIQQGRIKFKGQFIHKIQMWTKYGYRDGKIWIIHHKDLNPFNNYINNLIFLTKAEHNSIHKTGNNGRIGCHHSEENKKKISEAGKGRTFFNNGIKMIFVKPENCPEGYIKGKLIKCK